MTSFLEAPEAAMACIRRCFLAGEGEDESMLESGTPLGALRDRLTPAEEGWSCCCCCCKSMVLVGRVSLCWLLNMIMVGCFMLLFVLGSDDTCKLFGLWLFGICDTTEGIDMAQNLEMTRG